jgi:hypothetical protein
MLFLLDLPELPLTEELLRKLRESGL